MQETYKEFTLKIDEKTSEIIIYKDNSVEGSAKNIISARKMVDVIIKKESKFKKYQAFRKKEYSDAVDLVTVTSITVGGDFWIKDESNNRKKLWNDRELYPYDENNIKIVDKINSLRLEITSLRQKLVRP